MDNNKWSFIARLLSVAREGSEATFQNQIMSVFTSDLSWPDSLINREYPIRMGSTYKRVDFVLKNESQLPIIAIEVKTPNAQYDGVEQLGSYMNAMYPRLRIGMVIKDQIYVFYDEANGRKLTSLSDAIISIPFDTNCVNGAKFVELFDFDRFNFENLCNLCIEKKRSIEKERENEKKIQEIINILTGHTGAEFIKDAIVEKIKNDIAFSDIPLKIIQDAVSKIDLKASMPSDLPSFNHRTICGTNGKTNILDSTKRTSIYMEDGKVPKYYLDGSRKEFIKKFYAQGYGYIHWVMRNGQIETNQWNNVNNSIDEENINGNITTRNFWRQNKHEISKIVISSQKSVPEELIW